VTYDIPKAVEAVRLYAISHVAERLEVSETWVRKQIHDGRLRAVELGSTRAKTRVRADDLQRFIDERTFPKEEHDG
jgi:excisionase family DNA binding protein